MQLRIDPTKCTGCQLCVIYCSVKHRRAVDPSKANITILADHAAHTRLPFTCFQCPDAPCQAACPTEAILRNEETNALWVERELCIACGACVAACPYGNMFLFDGEECAQKCDLCDGSPECAAVCPQAAITVAEGKMSDGDIAAALERGRAVLGKDPVRR